MRDFSYHRPKDVAGAVSALKSATEGKLLAGGMTLLPTLKHRLAAPSDLIDLSGVPGLVGVKVEGRDVVIGAMTCHADVAASAELRKAIPALADLAGGIADPAVRHRGTIGGSIANADPAADYPAGVLGLDATVVTNTRTIAADDFFTGFFSTALEPGEIITSVRFPIPDKAAYAKMRHPASGYAVVGVMVAQRAGAVRVAVTGAGPSVFRVTAMEQALAKRFAVDAIAGITVPPDDLMGDIHCSAEYRADMVGVFARRAVKAITD
jgi:carbon-monoxide dehydrogenase medium subunit